MTQYHVTLNGQGYVIDLDRYRKRVRPPFAPKRASGAAAVADLVGPEQVFVWSDWSGGEGYAEHDPDEPGRLLSAAGVDGYSVPGTLRLGPYAASVQATTETFLRSMAVYKGKLYVGTGSGKLYSWDGTTWTNVGTSAAMIQSLAVFLGNLYAGNISTGALSKWDGTTFTATAATAGGPIWALATHYRQAAQYLYVGSQGAGAGGTGRLVYWDGSALSTGQFDTEEKFPIAGGVVNERLYLAASEVDGTAFGIYSVDAGGSGGTWRVHARERGGGPFAAAVLGDAIFLGDIAGGRIWEFDAARQEVRVVRELAQPGAPYTALILGMAAWRGALWVGIAEGATQSVLRYDGTAWTRPVVGLSGAGLYSMAVFGNDLFMGGVDSGGGGQAKLWRVQATVFAASGQAVSGLIDFGLAGVTKLLRSVTLVVGALVSPQTVQVEYQLEGTGGWTSLGTLSTVGATTATYAFATNVTCRQVSFRLTLAGTAGASSTPVVHQLAVRYTPRPALSREWEVPLVLEGTAELPLVTLDGATETLTGAQLSAAAWTAAGAAGPLTYVDLDGASYAVYVADLREEVAKVSQRRGYQRLGVATLVEAV